MESEESGGYAGPSLWAKGPRKSSSEFEIVGEVAPEHLRPIQNWAKDKLHGPNRIPAARKRSSSSKSSTHAPFAPGRDTLSKKLGQPSTPARTLDVPGSRHSSTKSFAGRPPTPPRQDAVVRSRRKLVPEGLPINRPLDGYLNRSQMANDDLGHPKRHHQRPAPISSRRRDRHSRSPSFSGEEVPIDDEHSFHPNDPFRPGRNGMSGSYPVQPLAGPSRPLAYPTPRQRVYSKGGDSSSIDQSHHRYTRNISQSSSTHVYHEPPTASGRRHSTHRRVSSSSPEYLQLHPPPPRAQPPSALRQSSPQKSAFHAHDRPGSGHYYTPQAAQTRQMSREIGSNSPTKRSRSDQRRPEPPSRHPDATFTIPDDEESEEQIENPDELSDVDGIRHLPNPPGNSVDRKGKRKERPAETPSHKAPNGSMRGANGKHRYEELQEAPEITGTLRPRERKDSQDGKIRQMAQRYESQTRESQRRNSGADEDWTTVDGPSKNDLRIRGAASRSKSPEKPANGEAQSKNTDMSITQNGPIPPSLRQNIPQFPRTPSGPQPHVAGLEKSWMYVNEHYLPLSLDLLHVAIQGHNLVFYSKKGPKTPSVPVDIKEISRSKVYATSEQSLLWVDMGFEHVETLRSFIEMTRPTDSVKDYRKAKLTVVMQFEKGDKALHLVDFFARFAKNTHPEILDEEMAGIIIAQGTSDRGTTTRNSARKAPFLIDAAKEIEAGSSKSTPRAAGQPAKRGDVEQLSARAKGKAPRKSGERDPTQPTLSFLPASSSTPKQSDTPSNRPRRSSRKSGAAQPNYDESEDASDVPKASNVKPLPASERNVLLFNYPLQGRAWVQLTKGEKHRVENGDFLNDILVEFGLRHVLEGLKPETLERVHLFNSFFYNKISDKKTKIHKPGPDVDKDHKDGDLDPWPGYDSVKKWTKKAEIFKKDFLIIPINEEFHWYLAIIYRPSGILKQRSPSPTPSRPKASPEPNPLTEDQQSSPPPPSPQHTTRSRCSPVLARSSHSEDQVDAAMGAEVTTDPDQSIDPIDSLNDGPDYGLELEPGDDVKMTSQGMKRLSLNQSSPTKDADGDVDMEAKPAAQPGLAFNILDGDDCWIFTFDSLGGSHKAVCTHLNKWLEYEANDKEQIAHRRPRVGRYVEAKVPSQPNFSDCGLFLVHYAKQLLTNSDETLRFLQRSAPRSKTAERAPWEADMKTAWKEDETKDLRRSWVDDIDIITGQYRSMHDIKGSEPPEPPKAEVEKAAKSAPPEVPSTQESVMELDGHDRPAASTRGASAGPGPSTHSPNSTSHVLPSTIAFDRVRHWSAEPAAPRQTSVPVTRSEVAHPPSSDALDPELYTSVRLVNSEQDMRDRIATRHRSVSRPRSDRSPSFGDIHPDLFPSPHQPTLEVVDEVVQETTTIIPPDSESASNGASSTSEESVMVRFQAGQTPQVQQLIPHQSDPQSPFEGFGGYHDSQPLGHRIVHHSPGGTDEEDAAISSTDDIPPSEHIPGPIDRRGRAARTAHSISDDDEVMSIDPNIRDARDSVEEEDEPVESGPTVQTPNPGRTPRPGQGTQSHRESSALTPLPSELPDSPVLSPPKPSPPREPSLPLTATRRSVQKTYAGTSSTKNAKKRQRASADVESPTSGRAGKSTKRAPTPGPLGQYRSEEEDELPEDVEPDRGGESSSGPAMEPTPTRSQPSRQAKAGPGNSREEAITID